MQNLESITGNYAKSQAELIQSDKVKPYARLHTRHYINPSHSNISTTSSNLHQEQLIRRADYKICIVNSHEQRIETNKLVQSRYASKGYLTDNSTTPHQNLHQITFEASNDHQLFGTISLTIDSNDGLLSDSLYANEINNLRNKNRTVCELSKFASHTAHGSKEVFAALFHLAHIYAYILNDVQDAVIEVNPRHAFFYKRMLGFHQIGAERICERVNAPAILLHLDLDFMRQQIISLSPQNPSNSRTIYPYFLSQHEEKRLTKKLEKFFLQEKTLNTISNTQHDIAVSCH